MNIYVANISYLATEDKLKELFQESGSVNSVKIILDNLSGKSRGFGFVEMSDDSDGKKAITKLNGLDFLGRNLVVNEARPKIQRPVEY